MPTYDYQCSQCSKSFELFLSLAERGGDSEKKVCPYCSSKSVEPLMTFNGGIISSDSSPCSSQGCSPKRGGCSGGGCPFGH